HGERNHDADRRRRMEQQAGWRRGIEYRGAADALVDRTMRRSRNERGTTLVEILISLTVVLIGMLALFRVLASSVAGAATASRLNQAQLRAESILEAIRIAPAPALACLAANAATNWSNCETICKVNQTSAQADSQTCIYTTSSMTILAAPDPASPGSAAPN